MPAGSRAAAGSEVRGGRNGAATVLGIVHRRDRARRMAADEKRLSGCRPPGRPPFDAQPGLNAMSHAPVRNWLRRFLNVVAILSAATVPAMVEAAAPMGFDEARHLLNRTSFAANVDDIETFAR